MDEQNRSVRPDDQASETGQNAIGAAQGTANRARAIKGAVGNIGQKTEQTLRTAGKTAKSGGEKAEKIGKGMQAASKAAQPIGAGAGAAIGGAIGSVIPGAGTAAGAALGGKIGNALGKGAEVGMNAAGKGLESGGRVLNKAGKKMELGADKLQAIREKIQDFFSLDGLKRRALKIIKSPKFWILVAIISFFALIFFTIEIQKMKAYEFVGELVETLKQNIGKEVYAKGYGTFGALTQDEFERVTTGVKQGKAEDGSTIAKSEIPFFGMNARRMGGSSFSSISKNILPNNKLGYNLDNSITASKLSKDYYGSTFKIKPIGIMTSGFGRYGEYNNLLSLSIPVYAGNGQVNLDYNGRLDQVCTDAERERIVYYLECERNSIIKAPIEEKTPIVLTISSIADSFKNFFNKIFGEDAPSDDNRDYGSGKNKIKEPRLTLKNAKFDFDKSGKLKDLGKFVKEEIIIKNEKKVDGSFGLPDDIYDFYPGSTMEDQIKSIDKAIKTEPAKDKPSPMMAITEKMVENGDTIDMEMDDALYRILEPYALDWKFLYTIDKAIDENIYDNFEELKKKDVTEKDKETIKKELIEKFMYVDIPKFMPQYKVVRHVVRDYNYSWQQVHSCSKDDKGNTECDDTFPEDKNFKRDAFTPEYKLEWVDILTKDQFMPTCQVLDFEYREVKSKPTDAGSFTHTKTLTMKSRPEYFKKSMGRGNDNYVSGKPEIQVNNSGAEIDRTIKFTKIVWYPEKDPKRYTKRNGIKKLFEDDYGLNLYDIRHALYLMDGNTYFPTARMCIAWIYGINLKNISSKSNYSNGATGAGGDGWNVNVDFVRKTYPSYPIVSEVFTDENIAIINKLGPENDIPTAAWAAQMIKEAGWQLKYSRTNHNLSGIKFSGSLASFGSYKDYFEYYATKLVKQPNFSIATTAARNGWKNVSGQSISGINQDYINAASGSGAEAYLFGLQDNPPDQNYCQDTSCIGYLYPPDIIDIMNENQLKGSGGGSSGASTGLDGLRNTIILTAESQLGLPYVWGGKSPNIGAPSGGLDCSGYVQWVMINAMSNKDPFDAYGSTSALHQAIDDGVLEEISESEIQPGDIFIRTAHVGEAHGSNDHTGFYWGTESGDKMIIHEPHSEDVCKKSKMTETYRTWCRLKGISGSYSSFGGSYSGANVFNLPDSYFDSSKDEEVDANYDGGPEPWGEDFAGSGTIGSLSGSSGSLGPNEVGAQGFSWPISNDVQIHAFTRGYKYGNRDSGFHTGIDLSPNNGMSVPIYAAKDGKVIKVRDKGNTSYGKYVEIEHEGGVTTIYAHMKKNTYFKEGDAVTKGQQIGDMGSTGNSTGMHLHFEVRALGKDTDPEKFLPAR